MKLLWFSATPECHSGYGNATRHMMGWLTKQDHFVVAATKHPVAIRWRMWDVPGTDVQRPIVCGTNIERVNKDMIEAWNLDACISMFDVWGLKTPLSRHIPWVPIDTQNVSEKIIKVVADCPMVIAMTQHGVKEFESFDIRPEYAPIGYDPGVFHYDHDLAQEFRSSLTWKDGLSPNEMFLIGSVGLNYPDDRKGFVILLQAFKKLREQYPEARLYLHTQAVKEKQGMNYARIANELGLMEYIGWADPTQFWLGQYTEQQLAGIYSAMDVFCLPTRGEGFGMPVIEAQGCGTPVVVTDNTSGRELAKSGTVIPVDSDDWVYTGLNTWRVQPKPSAVTNMLIATRDRGPTPRDKVTARVIDYTWENVWEQHWGPIIDKIEDMLPLERGNEDGLSGEVCEAMEGQEGQR